MENSASAANRGGIQRKSLDAVKSSNSERYMRMSISDLRTEKDRLIDEMQFEESAIVESVIKSKAVDNTESVIAELDQLLSQQIEKAFASLDEGMVEAEKVRSEEENKSRAEFAKLEEETAQRHQAEMKDLEDKKQGELEREKQRPIAKELETRNKAKILARSDEIEEALRLRDAAASERVNGVEKRISIVEDSYAHKQAALLANQEREMLTLQLQLSKAVSGSYNKYDRTVTDLQAKTANYVRNALRLAINKGTKHLEIPARRTELSQRLSAIVEQRIIEAGRSDLFGVQE